MQETRVTSLGWEDSLEEEIATQSSILAWRILWTEEPGGLQSVGSLRIRHDRTTNFHFSFNSSFILGTLKYMAFLVAQLVKNLPAMRDTWVPSLGQEDSPEKGKATRSSTLAWRIPWTVESMALQRVRHDRATFTHSL